MTININKPATNNVIDKVSEGVVKSTKHKHKLKVTNDLERINKNRCDICKETGGCIYYCDMYDDEKEDDCDFDMCYDCKRQEQPDTATSRFSTGFQVASIFDNRPTISKNLEIKGHHSDRINALCLYIPPLNYRKSLATVITGGEDCIVCIFNLFSGALVRKLENQHEGPITSIQLFQHPKDENHISVITGSKDKSIIIWDYNTGKVRRILKEHKNYITGLSLHYRIIPPSQEVKEERISIFVISVDQDSKGYIWDYQSGTVKQNTDGSKRILNSNNEGHKDPISCVVLCHWREEKEEKRGKKHVKVSTDRYAIVTADEQNKLVSWDLSAKMKFEELYLQSQNPFTIYKQTHLLDHLFFLRRFSDFL
jgi:WD40 repeat protein